jgi:hypothetical protein
MYTNIPTNELLRTTDTACQNNYIDENIKQSIIKLTKTIIDQNYFQFLDTTYIQSEGLAMEHQHPPYYLNFTYNT